MPGNSKEYLDTLLANGAEKILILTDLDEDACITFTKNRITTSADRIVIVAVRNIESWFLADSQTLSLLLRQKFEFEQPENEITPFETLRNIFLEKQNRGIGDKDILAARMIKYGFSLENAARHPNCPSATYFLNKLQQLATE